VTDLVTVGETMAVLRAPHTGRLRDSASLWLSIAGSESNTAIGLTRLGSTAAWIGRVGGDEFGQLILARLRAEGVDASGCVVDAGAQTALMFRERRTQNVDRVTYYRRGHAGSRLTVADLDESLIAAARVVHVTGITLGLSDSAREAAFAAAEIARTAGVLVSFDVNYRSALWAASDAAGPLRAMAERADVVFAGESELGLIEPGDTLAAARRLAGEGARTVVVRRGAAGAFSVDGGTVFQQPARPVTAVDPVGAGDAFNAGYLCALLDGVSEQARLALGGAVGAHAVTIAGDWEGLPTRDDLALADLEDGTALRLDPTCTLRCG
jgi:2-dehydro-3-deoxygluconokinase